MKCLLFFKCSLFKSPRISTTLSGTPDPLPTHVMSSWDPPWRGRFVRVLLTPEADERPSAADALAQSLAVRRGCEAAGAGGEGRRRRSSAGLGRRAERRAWRRAARPARRAGGVLRGSGAGLGERDVEMRLTKNEANREGHAI